MKDGTPKDRTPKDGTPKDGTPKVEIDQNSESRNNQNSEKFALGVLFHRPHTLTPSPVCIFDLSQFQTLKRAARVMVSKMYLMKTVMLNLVK